ncbi:MAG TPA: hypothetical protein VH165_16505 [Kofleriaceae bacterium]|nr:hypothetical protein [Kofleriaceae bacterium]
MRGTSIAASAAASLAASAAAAIASVALVAGPGGCSHEAPPPVAPKGPTACARASDSMVQTMLDRLSTQDAPPTDAADAMRNLIRERCEQDGWSPEATQCLIAMKSQDDAANCAKLMTDDQQAALVRDEQAQFGGKPGAGSDAGSAAPVGGSAAAAGGSAAPAGGPAARD